MSAKPKIIVPLNIPPDLQKKIDHAASKLEKSKAETMRIAMEIGIERLEVWNYKLYAAMAANPAPALRVADEPMGNELSPSTRVDSVKYPPKKEA